MREEEANASRCCDLDTFREHLGDFDTQARDGDDEENDALNEDGSEGNLPLHDMHAGYHTIILSSALASVVHLPKKEARDKAQSKRLEAQNANRNAARSTKTDDVIGEVGIQAHAWRESEGQVGKRSHRHASNTRR